MTDKDDNEAMSFLDTAKSVAAGFLGVQSKKNASRDFSKGKASHFIIVGFIGAVIFVCVIATAVNLMIGHLGK